MTKTLARALSLGLVLAVVTVSAADARQRRSKVKKQPSVVELLQRVIADNKRILSDNAKLHRELHAISLRLRPDNVVVATADPEAPLSPSNPALAAPMPIPDITKTIKGYEHHIAKSAKMKDLTPMLASKVAHILSVCPGSRLTSGHRPGARVRGSGRPSLHGHYPSRAADVAGNPSCIRRAMAGWPGGMSTDYAAVRHYHISYAPGGREWGARFAHYRGSRGSHRVARHHSAPRYAKSTVQTASVHAPQ